MPLENLSSKFKAFNWNCTEVKDGHSFKSLITSFKKKNKKDKPSVIIMNTIKGKGIKEFEEGIFSEEKAAYGDCRTNAEDLYQSHLTLFETQNPFFVNVCGKKIWLSKEPQLLKDYF